MNAACTDLEPALSSLAALADQRGLKLGLRAPRRLGIWSLQVAVARPLAANRAELLAEMKGWALPQPRGLQLDTLQVLPGSDPLVGPLIWAATMAWALEATPCRRARFLAIRDGDHQHRRLVRYFRQLGFTPIRELGAAPLDLPLRLLWGGSGLLMSGDCRETLRRCSRRLRR
ncbi:MAG: hypothetical protein VKN15_03880 [Cyanobacteriota bacterium]|nr:hypothetical protein [Cyanobacteriota bacterium]